ncbi:MAG: aldehyde dehydrogenase [Clostridia bacterium]|nr:aldehyde dehydrogenase [Clostridia bacterium]
MQNEEIVKLVENHKKFYTTGKTKNLSFRIEQLKKLKSAIEKYEDAILDALEKDLSKPAHESYASEIGFVLNEIDYMIKKIHSFSKPKRVKTPILYWGGSSYIIPEPYGVALIIGPWNYPFQLLMSPLAGAMAAGNCSVLKPSELAPHVSSVIKTLVCDTFETQYISVVEGSVEASTTLLQQKVDYIFFTGGTRVGKVVMEAAAKNLIPVTLELGGKSPCIVDKDIHLNYTARRIAWGKFLNAGQTCVAPDYLLVHKDIAEKLCLEIVKSIEEFYGKDPLESKHYVRIINEKHFDRLVRLLDEGKIFYGGQSKREERYISPTIIRDLSFDSLIMQDEIFGPLLPVIEYQTLDEAIEMINRKPKPLALYIFSKNKKIQDKVLEETSSGGVSVNDTISHITTKFLPFGGVGESGMGNYHGRASFDTFSHKKSVLKNTFLFDAKLKYPPYTISLKWFKKLLKLV